MSISLWIVGVCGWLFVVILGSMFSLFSRFYVKIILKLIKELDDKDILLAAKTRMSFHTESSEVSTKEPSKN